MIFRVRNFHYRDVVPPRVRCVLASDVYFTRAREETTSKSIGFTLLTLVAGWWRIPFGPIFTVQALVTNFRGGKGVTKEVVSSLAKPAAPVPVG